MIKPMKKINNINRNDVTKKVMINTIKHSENGITLVALVISIIIMLMLAGVSLNATIGENGILAQAAQARIAQEEAANLEELGMILYEYNSAKFFDGNEKFENYLFKLRQKGTIEAYILKDQMKMIKFKGAYYKIEEQGKDFVATGKISDDLASNLAGESYVVTPENANEAGNLEFTTGSDYTIMEEIETEGFNFVIPSANGDPSKAVSIHLVENMRVDNVGYSRSAIELMPGAILNLYIYGTVEVHSEYGEDGEAGNKYGAKGGPGGYAGIHVPEGATLNLYGTGTLIAYGGNAGDGLNGTGSYGSGGGGGAGAGIGGNGGRGGNGNKTEIAHNYYAASKNDCGEDGQKGENAGTINIYDTLTVYAYGGAGGAGGTSGTSSGGGGGGYPAAGIGGGGAGGGGGDHQGGAGGFSGGSKAGGCKFVGINGLGSGVVADDKNNGFTSGAGYYGRGHGQAYTNGKAAFIGGHGGGACYGLFGAKTEDGWCNDTPGSGGIAGSGGTVTIAGDMGRIKAFNGDMITNDDYTTAYYKYNADGTTTANKLEVVTRQDGKKIIPANIFIQEGIIRPAYVSNNLEISKYEDIVLTLVENTNRTITPFAYGQGIGSGAGYIEVSNGTLTIN